MPEEEIHIPEAEKNIDIQPDIQQKQEEKEQVYGVVAESF
jgi:hypothetical protein